jgi:hypothetical protein
MFPGPQEISGGGFKKLGGSLFENFYKVVIFVDIKKGELSFPHFIHHSL